MKSASQKECRRSPEDMTVHMLISDIARMSHGEARAVGKSLNLAPSVRSLLFHLCHKDGLTQLELSKLTGLKPPTISITLDKMERDGYVERHQGETDRRKVMVYVTEKGKNLDGKIKSVYMEKEKVIGELLTEEETATLKALLIKVRKAVSKA